MQLREQQTWFYFDDQSSSATHRCPKWLYLDQSLHLRLRVIQNKAIWRFPVASAAHQPSKCPETATRDKQNVNNAAKFRSYIMRALLSPGLWSRSRISKPKPGAGAPELSFLRGAGVGAVCKFQVELGPELEPVVWKLAPAPDSLLETLLLWAHFTSFNSYPSQYRKIDTSVVPPFPSYQLLRNFEISAGSCS